MTANEQERSAPEVDPLDSFDLTDEEKTEIRAWIDKRFAAMKPWSDRQVERVLAAMRT